MKNFTLILLLLVFLYSNRSFGQASGFQLIKKTVIGGEGGWDYLSVDSENRRLYVSHSTKVEVLDADTHEKVGESLTSKGFMVSSSYHQKAAE